MLKKYALDKVPADVIASFIEMWEDDVPIFEIGHKLKISAQFGYKLAKHLKLEPRNRGQGSAALPTPEEIAARALEIQKNWSEKEREKRHRGPKTQSWSPPAFAYRCGSGTFDTIY